MRAKNIQELPADLSVARSAMLSAKVREAMAKMMAAAKARRVKHTTARGRIKAAFSPSIWRAGARRWLPLRAGQAVVLPDSAASRAAVEAEAKMIADALIRLSPAISRAAVYGLPVTVKAGDVRTAEVFRAALVHTSAARSSDRLVRIVVDA
jgi:hypothetical protein